MNLPLFDREGICSFVNLTEKILYLQTNGYGKIRLYSGADEYRPVHTVEEWFKLLGQSGFVRVDRGTIVNLRKVCYFDPVLRILGMRTENGGQVVVPVAETMIRRLKVELTPSHRYGQETGDLGL